MYTMFVLLGSFLVVSALRVSGGHYGVIPPQNYLGRADYAIDETPKPYQFAYQAEAIGGASARQEAADGSGTVVGSYSLSDVDGRQRVVDYVADGAGFRASVKTNEPGTKSESPADVPTVSAAVDAPVAIAQPATYSAAYGYPHGSYGSLGHRGYGYGGYYGGALGHGRYYGGALGHGRYYGGSLGNSRYYGGALGHGHHGGALSHGYYGGALGHGRYYGGALGAYGLLGYGNYGGYGGLGYGGRYPYSYGHGYGRKY